MFFPKQQRPFYLSATKRLTTHTPLTLTFPLRWFDANAHGPSSALMSKIRFLYTKTCRKNHSRLPIFPFRGRRVARWSRWVESLSKNVSQNVFFIFFGFSGTMSRLSTNYRTSQMSTLPGIHHSWAHNHRWSLPGEFNLLSHVIRRHKKRLTSLDRAMWIQLSRSQRGESSEQWPG